MNRIEPFKIISCLPNKTNSTYELILENDNGTIILPRAIIHTTSLEQTIEINGAKETKIDISFYGTPNEKGELFMLYSPKISKNNPPTKTPMSLKDIERELGYPIELIADGED